MSIIVIVILILYRQNSIELINILLLMEYLPNNLAQLKDYDLCSVMSISCLCCDRETIN
jgi:hypothetical protein